MKSPIDNLDKAKIFYKSPSCSIMLFHDGTDVIPGLASEGVFDFSICYFSFSWYVSNKSLMHVQQKVKEAADCVGIDKITDRVKFLFNSTEELERARQVIPPSMCIFFNNASLINENMFDVGGCPEHDAVYNARANSFKRHHLSSEVKDKIFIAYDWKYSDYDLKDFNPKEIFLNLQGGEVSRAIKKAKVGLMLSEEEGACYASLEYLLCGLPVVSTPSRGGRDVFYKDSNSIICCDNKISVAEAVSAAVRFLEEGFFNKDDIRNSAIEKMKEQRSFLCRHMESFFFSVTGESLPKDILNLKARETNKLWKFRNMRVKQTSELRS